MPPRVMWLLNHSTARRFEVPMLKAVGIEEIFLPKIFPSDPSFRSASIDESEDRHLTIPPDDLAIMNAADWYVGANENAWRVANRYFDLCFFILHDLAVLRAAAKHFNGALVWRTFGLQKEYSYSKNILALEQGAGWRWISKLGKRFHFAKAYAHIDRIESDVLKRRSVHLPLGLHEAKVEDRWEGNDKRIFFVCPDVGFNPYYQDIYTKFSKDFEGLPYLIGGAQPVRVHDPAVLGFQPQAAHDENMRQLRAMFYHSTDPDHIHYHPFEAIRAGMPLLFMAGGMLDRMGGLTLPGRCTSVADARAKAKRLLDNDRKLIDAIRNTQARLLESMRPENCIGAWREGMAKILKELAIASREQAVRYAKPPRIAVILPISYRGGTLRGAKLLAHAIYEGSRASGFAAEIVFAYPDDAVAYSEADFADLAPAAHLRTFRWKRLTAPEARRAMRYSGHAGWEPQREQYLAMDDGIRHLVDCDVWLVVSDRLSAPLLPMRPVVHMIYDYAQRYFPILPHGADNAFIDAARLADVVLVTTRATGRDAQQYAGLSPDKVVKVPVLAQQFSRGRRDLAAECSYFIWTTNAALHKNHRNALMALKLYYEQHDGRLDCVVSGQDTRDILANPAPHLQTASRIVHESDVLQRRLRWCGELSEADYQDTLANAAFLWHASVTDNGTLSVVEAASLGIPALSTDYPAIREIDEQFALNLAWMDASDPDDMAAQLKQMEGNYVSRRGMLPSDAQLATQRVDRLGAEYWAAVSRCL